MYCYMCNWWEKLDEKDKDCCEGYCLRNAPLPQNVDSSGDFSPKVVWPTTGQTDRCGEFKKILG